MFNSIMKNTPNNMQRVIIPRKIWEEGNRKLLDNLRWISNNDIQAIVKAMKEAEEIRIQREKLTKSVLEYLKNNHVEVEENKEMLGYKWKIVHLDLPAAWEFKWFKFNYFESYDTVFPDVFEKKSYLEKYSYSIKEVSELLNAMNEYMRTYWVFMDAGMDFENDLKNWETKILGCDTWKALKEFMWLNWKKNWREKRDYRMKDKKIKKGYRITDKKIEIDDIFRVKWFCFHDDDCRFVFMYDHNDLAYLFLKVAD